MKERVATITSKGQVTIPAEIRRYLGLKKNDKIAFVVQPDGTVQLRAPPYPTIASLAGAAGSLKTPMPWKEMIEVAREDALVAKYRRASD